MSSRCPNFGADDEDIVTRFSFHREQELKVMLSYLPHDMRSDFDKWIRTLVKEEIELSHKNQTITITQTSQNYVSRNLELRISNIIPQLFTGEPLKGIGGMPVNVTLFDSCTKEKVKLGPEASGKVEVVVIKAEVENGSNEYECKLVCHGEEKKSVHVNSFSLKLKEGTAGFPKVSFIRNKRWTKIAQLRLQARFVDKFDGVHVKEANTKPFLLCDRRNEASMKHPTPSLDDDVWRLDNIAKDGTLSNNLIKAGIKTVGDFIVSLFLHRLRLEKILGAKRLKATEEHAQKCPAILMYRSSFDHETKVIFKVSGEVMGLHEGDLVLSSDALSETQKGVAKKLVISAFENWQDVTSMNEDQSVEYCTHLLEENMLHDGQDPSSELVHEFVGIRYDEVYCEFEGLCTSIPIEAGKNRPCKRWRKLFCVVTFTRRGLDDFHAHKKQRFA
ncbi:hypothetical protein SSX86_007816 [Deinandra increscens subsp. villosa]|uniref:Uncharacterized protein n=1 Tax=Deinandra increscens subsp. villosa TaxID=3103831 RepID=A0AAP0DIS4_9ASTR